MNEDELRHALHAIAGDTLHAPVATRDTLVAAAARRARRRRVAASVVGVAAAAAIALGVQAAVDDDSSRLATRPPTTDLRSPITVTSTPVLQPPKTIVATTSKGAVVLISTETGASARMTRDGFVKGRSKPSFAALGKSSDGSVYVGTSDTDIDCRRSGVYRVSTGDVPPERIATGSHPAVTGDGTWLAYAAPPAASNGTSCLNDIVVRNTSTGEEKTWPAPPGDPFGRGTITALAWEDGTARRLAFEFAGDGTSVYVIDIDWQRPGDLSAARPVEPLGVPKDTGLTLPAWAGPGSLVAAVTCCYNPDGMTGEQVRTTNRTVRIDLATRTTQPVFAPGETHNSLDYADDGSGRLLRVTDRGVLEMRDHQGGITRLDGNYDSAAW